MPDHHHHHHWGSDADPRRDHGRYHGDEGRDRYAYHAGEPGPGPNRHKLYRNMRAGKIAGVCAGIADYFGFKVGHVRIATVLATIFMVPPAVIVAYLAGAFFLPIGDPISARYNTKDEERFWRSYSARPRATISEMKHRFRALEARVADMERTVTSEEYSLRKEFRDLEGKA